MNPEMKRLLKLYKSIDSARSITFEKLCGYETIFARRRYIAENFSSELEEEYEYINNLLKEELGL